MAQADFKPDDDEWRVLHAALCMAYADPDHLRHVLIVDFPEIAGNVNFNAGSMRAVYEALDHVDRQGVDWARFLQVLRRVRSDSAKLSAIVDRILLSGALAGLDGTLVQIAGLDGAERTAFNDWRPPLPEDTAGKPPTEEGQRVAWYANRLVGAGRLSHSGAIPVLLFVESIRRAVAHRSAATAAQLEQWIEKTAETVAVNEGDRKQIVTVTRNATTWLTTRHFAPRPSAEVIAPTQPHVPPSELVPPNRKVLSKAEEALLLERFYWAMCKKFDKDKPGLEKLTQIGLNVRLQEVVSGDAIRPMIFQLIAWAVQCGRLAELARAVMAARPKLHAVCSQVVSTFG